MNFANAFKFALRLEDATGIYPARHKRRDGAPCLPGEAKFNQYNPIPPSFMMFLGLHPRGRILPNGADENALNVVLPTT